MGGHEGRPSHTMGACLRASPLAGPSIRIPEQLPIRTENEIALFLFRTKWRRRQRSHTPRRKPRLAPTDFHATRPQCASREKAPRGTLNEYPGGCLCRCRRAAQKSTASGVDPQGLSWQPTPAWRYCQQVRWRPTWRAYRRGLTVCLSPS
jgi:hypothetical protein